MKVNNAEGILDIDYRNVIDLQQFYFDNFINYEIVHFIKKYLLG